MGEGYSLRKYHRLGIDLPEPIYAALKLAAKRRDVAAEQLAVGLLAGILAGGNIESTLGRNGGYSFMRFRTPAQEEYHRNWKKEHKARSSEAAAAAGMKSP